MHSSFLQIALNEAWKGRGFCAPNPSVGACAVHNQNIIAQAHHQGAGSPHAEILVLNQIPPNLQGITLYITLEPCNHWGKTPPCSDAIIQHGGIVRVVFGYYDPNPTVSKNNTTQLLQAQGIEVIHYPMPSINQFYRSYQYWTQSNQPWITAKIAQSLDSKIALDKKIPVTITNSKCAEFTHTQRLHSDILLTTAQTIHSDNPLFNVRLNQDMIAKPLAIIDRQCTLTEAQNIFKTASHCHIFHGETHRYKHPMSPHCTLHAIPEESSLLDLSSIIKKLGQIGYHDVWIEAGSTLFAQLQQQNLVQTTYIYIAPKILGPHGINAFPTVFDFCQNKSVQWQMAEDNIILCLENDT